LSLKLITSPGKALMIAARSDPGPLSLVLVTIIVALWLEFAANAGQATRLENINPKITFDTMLDRITLQILSTGISQSGFGA
jgi:hypothetical protein